MKYYWLNIFLFLLVCSCGTVEDPVFDGINCEEDCIIFEGRVINVNDQEENINTTVQINYRGGGVGFNPTNVFAVVNTDANGRYSARFMADSSEIRRGYFELITEPEGFRPLFYDGKLIINDLTYEDYFKPYTADLLLRKKAALNLNIKVLNNDFERLGLNLKISEEEKYYYGFDADELTNDTTIVLSAAAQQFNTLFFNLEKSNGNSTKEDSIFLLPGETKNYEFIID